VPAAAAAGTSTGRDPHISVSQSRVTPRLFSGVLCLPLSDPAGGCAVRCGAPYLCTLISLRGTWMDEDRLAVYSSSTVLTPFQITRRFVLLRYYIFYYIYTYKYSVSFAKIYI